MTKFAVPDSRSLVLLELEFGIFAADIAEGTEMHTSVCETCKLCEQFLIVSHFFCLMVLQ